MASEQVTALHRVGRLSARPSASPSDPTASPPGVRALHLAPDRDCLLFVPGGYQPERATPLIVTLHGAGGTAHGGLAPLLSLAESAGVLLLSPAAAGVTWDAVGGSYGPDVALLDEALATTFARHAVDTRRLAISGFSDGASYALSLGLANGDLFTHIIAFSPGFVAAGPRVGVPDVFIAHGGNDTVLPIDRCSRRIVPALRRSHLAVDYQEFDGGHTVPTDIARRSLRWFLGAALA
ncbi:MAG TPA: phospholipase [Ktedonobacterales bacterium]|nr:phospholipase [Ktedonobacterales bacterium]